jgi:ribosome biogenesis GTPase A
VRNKVLLEDKDQFILLNLKTGKGKDKLFKLALDLTKEKRARDKAKGLLPRPIKACVVGMPNVGKSTFINWIIGQKRAKTGNAPGITKGAQWVRIHPQIELMDTPGFLPSTDYDTEAKFKLALLNLLPEAHYEPIEIAEQALGVIAKKYGHHLQYYFKDTLNLQEPTLAKIALARNYLQPGGVPDVSRAAMIFLSELRAGKLGSITLD